MTSDAPPPAVERAIRSLLDRLEIEASPEERRELALHLDRELGFTSRLEAMETAERLVAQVEKKIKLWKRIFLDEMLLHARTARSLLREARTGSPEPEDRSDES